MRKNWKFRLLALSLFAGIGGIAGSLWHEQPAQAIQCCSRCLPTYTSCMKACGSNASCQLTCEARFEHCQTVCQINC